MSWEMVLMKTFLKHRDLRFKPTDPDIYGLKRIDKIDFSGKIFISDKPSNTDMILIKKGDLVISGINVEKGAMAVYQGEDDLTATIHYSSYEYDEAKIDLEFLKCFLKSKEFVKAIKEQVPGGIKTEIKPKHILPLKVNIPTDVDDQRSIVTSLHSKNRKIETIGIQHSHQLDLLKKLHHRILQDAVQGNLVPQDPNDEPASKLLERIKSEKEQLIREMKVKEKIPVHKNFDNSFFHSLRLIKICRKNTGITTIPIGFVKNAATIESDATKIENFRFLIRRYDEMEINVKTVRKISFITSLVFAMKIGSRVKNIEESMATFLLQYFLTKK